MEALIKEQMEIENQLANQRENNEQSMMFLASNFAEEGQDLDAFIVAQQKLEIDLKEKRKQDEIRKIEAAKAEERRRIAEIERKRQEEERQRLEKIRKE